MSCIVPDVTGLLQSAEQWSSSARASLVSGEVSSSCRSLLLEASILLHYWPSCLLHVLGEELLAVGWASTAGCAWNVQWSCLIPPQPLWCCAAFSPPPAAQPLAAGPFPRLTFCRQRSRLFLQPLPSTSHWEHRPLPESMVLLHVTALELFLVHNQTH